MHEHVGRTFELAAMRRAAAQVEQKHEPRFLLIEGPAGIGKSALVNEAVKEVSHWWRANVYLDHRDQHKPGYAATHLLRKPQRYQAPTDQEELTEWVRSTVDAVTGPIVLVFEDLQWVDALSSDIIYQAVRETEFVPMYNLVTLRTTRRKDLDRFRRLAQTHGEALHIVLYPMSTSEIQEILVGHTGLPLSLELCERVKEATSGFPSYVAHMAQSLAASPAGRGRGIETALASIYEEDGPADHMCRVMADELREMSPPVRRVLELVSLSRDGLTPAQLRSLTGERPDLEALEDTCLVSTGGTKRRVRIHYHVHREGIRSQIPDGRRADLHRALAAEDSGGSALLQDAAAAEIDLLTGAMDDSDAGGLVDQLISRAGAAVAVEDSRSALELSRAAFGLSESEMVIQIFVRAALRSKRIHELQRVVPLLDDLPHGPLRAGISALLNFHTGRLDAGYAELSGATDLESSSVDALLIYAEAVAAAGWRNAAASALGRSREIFARTVASLRCASSDPTNHDQTRHQLRNMSLVIEMWGLLDSGVSTQEVVTGLTGLIDEAGESPGTRHAHTLLRAMRGALLRQTGMRRQALEDLVWVTQHWHYLDDGLTTFAKIQLAFTYFDAGLWDAAETVGTQAAAEVLGGSEDALSMIAYSLGALVPTARGDAGAWARTLDAVAASDGEFGALLQAPRHYALAWAAIAGGDHHRACGHLLKMQHPARGWGADLTSTVLLARALHYTGRSVAVADQLDSLNTSARVRSELVVYCAAHVQALLHSGRSEYRAAAQKFLAANQVLGSQPGIISGQSSGEAGGQRIYRALLAQDFGHCVLEAGDALNEYRDRAAELLVWAINLWSSCGAEGLVDQTESLLARLTGETPSTDPETIREVLAEPGAQPTRRLPGWISAEAIAKLHLLTDRERDVALIAGEGLSNNEIAQRLVLSVRTVETHMSNILSKLSMSSRRELYRILLPQSLN
ncbi:helix-turn-helix transcriptional regulator [Nesterenkonia muleiensis]|uniref:helix-turn-helix transcriptional regulator n=1 Tax=Nesterenkonia muleiensis TaxID=2282648 RepID=UPI0013903BB5|nr:LuxR C-terminal-related transcriptional regulator [Nesterenkonia muleiensis]